MARGFGDWMLSSSIRIDHLIVDLEHRPAPPNRALDNQIGRHIVDIKRVFRPLFLEEREEEVWVECEGGGMWTAADEAAGLHYAKGESDGEAVGGEEKRGREDDAAPP